MKARILAVTKAFAANRLALLLFALTGITIGLLIQLNWIHTACSGEAFFAAKTGKCGDNLARVILGGPTGIILLSVLFYSIYFLFECANKMAETSRLVTGLAYAISPLILIALLPIINFQHKKIVIGLSLLVCIIVGAFVLRKETINVLIMIKDFLLAKPAFVYDLSVKKGKLSFVFTGKFAESDHALFQSQILEDLIQQESDIKELFVDMSNLDVLGPDVPKVLLYVVAYANYNGLKLEAKLTADQSLSFKASKLVIAADISFV